MRYTVSLSIVQVVGRIWMPYGMKAFMEYQLTEEDVPIIMGGQIEQWLAAHTGDFSSIIGWRASLEDRGKTVNYPWSSEEAAEWFNSAEVIAHDW
jgi:hypothetical protein